MKHAARLAGLLLAVAGPAAAQGLGNAPYSRIGVGEYNPNVGGVRQMGMGGTGLAAPNTVNVNELNPALLSYTLRTTFEAGYTGQYKTISNANAQNRSGSGTLGYLALALPLSSKWGAAVGLKPVSSVDYESNVITTVTNNNQQDLSLNQYLGTGGISEAYLSQGFLLGKGLSIGATAGYVFGTTDETTGTTLQVNGVQATDKKVVRTHTRYSDFAFRAAAHYRHKLGEKLNLNLAGVYSFRHSINGQRLVTQEQQNASNTLVAVPVEVSNAAGSALVPALAQVGLSLDNNRNWSANLDVAQQQWSEFESFGRVGDPFSNAPLSNTMRVGLGGEFTPDPGSVEHYFRRVGYRVGLSVAQLPYRPGGQTLYDRAVSWGFAFPLPTATALEATTISLGFTYGLRGNTDVLNSTLGTSNVQESYIKGQLGVTINNRWFIKRRLL